MSIVAFLPLLFRPLKPEDLGHYWQKADLQPIRELLPEHVPETATFELAGVMPETVMHHTYGKVERRKWIAKWRDEQGQNVGCIVERHYQVRRFYTSNITGKTADLTR